MSDAYLVTEGDTWSRIAARVYGDDTQTAPIRQANPGAKEPLTVGQSIIVPRAQLATTSPASNDDETILNIDGQRFRFWDGVTLVRAIDAVPTVELTAPWEPSDETMRRTFQPFRYAPITLQVGAQAIFSGTLVGTLPEVTPEARTLTASAYARAGVLGDCTAPASAYPDAVQFNGMTLATIAEKVCSFFGLGVEVQTDTLSKFDRVTLATAEQVLPFLSRLAAQRNCLLTANAAGDLLVLKAATSGDPVARLVEGDSPVLGIIPLFNEQQHYSHVTGIEPVIVGLAGSQHTVKNAALVNNNVLRPYTYEVPDTASGAVPAAVETKAGRMFAATLSYSVRLNTWRDQAGALWEPNTIVTLSAPGAMIYNETRLLIRSVELQQDSGIKTATLDLVLVGSLSGEVPEARPWDL